MMAIRESIPHQFAQETGTVYTLLGLIGLSGFLISFIFIIVRTIKKQPRKPFVIALAVCLILFAVSLIIRLRVKSATSASTVPDTFAAPSASAPAEVETMSPTDPPAEAMAGVQDEVPAATDVPAEEPTAVPSEEPTAEPLPTVPPVSDEQLDEGYLDAWFSDSVIVGDSIAGGLSGYVTKERENGRPFLSNLRVIGTSGMTLKKALAAEKKETTGQVLFRSRFMAISEVVEITQAKRLFLMIGVRDLEWYSAEKLVSVYDQLISIIKTDHPDLRVYVHSIMPTVKDYARQAHLNYETRKTTNEKLRSLCEEKGYTYLELSDLVCDEEGFLKYEYSGKDYSWHPNDLGKAIWVKLLRSCARDEYYAGVWKPEN